MTVHSTERQINLVGTLLKARAPLYWDDIIRIEGYNDAAKVRTRQKRLERDLKAIQEAGFVVHRASDGVRVGYEVDRLACLLPTVNLTRDQRMLLYRVGVAYLEGGGAGPLGEHLAGALIKLQAGAGTGLPARLPGAFIKRTLNRRPAEAARLTVVGDALLSRRRVKFKYATRGNDKPAVREVEPWGLVSRRGGWYVVGRDVQRDDVRTFRLSRISGAVTATEIRFEVPAGFDPESAFSTALFGNGDGAFKDVRIRFDADVAFIVENEFEGLYPIKQIAGGIELHLPEAWPDELLRWLGEFPGHWQVLSPKPLRELIDSRLRAALERHGGRP